MNTKKTIDTLLLTRWLIPVEPHNVYHENYAIAIHEGRIIDILPNDIAQEKYQTANQSNLINLSEHAVLPGFINAHTHSPMALLRGLADDLALMDWLNNHIWPVEKKWLNEEFVKDATELALAEMIRCGTIGFNEHYFYHDTIAEATFKAKMRARIGILVLEIVDVGASGAKDLITKGIEFIEKYKNHPTIQVTLAPHAPYSVADDSLLQIKEIASTYDLPIHMHVQETAFEVNQETAKYKKSPLKRLQDLGLLSPKFQAVHMTQISDDDFDILKETGTTIVHCPESNLKLASGFCPVQRLLDAGITVALGTDGAASNNDLDMLAEMRTAALIGKAVAQSDTAVSAATALRMATLNGAISMQWDKETGSIEIGKSADIIAINLNALNTQPVYNPISQVVYAANSAQITHSWINGVCVMENRELKTLDEEAILAKAKVWQERISQK
jgi:5-methylthioadenosine/S-adenosylhomocysteine deaminase